MTAFRDILSRAVSVKIKQIREMAELFGFETTNKYSVTADGAELAFAAEQSSGALAFLVRQVLGHWRRFEITFVDGSGAVVLRALHPFRFYFQRLEVLDGDGTRLGALEQRFSLLSKKFDVHDRLGNVSMTVQSPLWRLWTFPFIKNGREAAMVRKRWGGMLKEAFLDADTFELEFTEPGLSVEERMLLLGAALFIDLQYFEKKSQ